MKHIGTFLGRAVLIVVPAALGLAAIFYSDQLRTLPEPTATARQPSLVRVITLEQTDLVARVRGYGTVAPARDWRAVARVEGEITEVADTLAPGNILPADTDLFRIDDSDLKLSLASIDAQISASKVKDETLQLSLEISEADLALAEEDLRRQEQLNSQGVVTQSGLDASKRQALVSRTKMTDLKNQITLNAAERDVLMTQRAAVERALSFAVIRAPFDMRVTTVDADIGQFVNRGQALLSGEGIDAAEIAAQFPMGRIGPLVRMAGDGAQITDLKARVTLPGSNHPVMWSATVDRMGEAIDERTQSAPLIVRVADPQAQSAAGKRPPLRRNMIVEVELSAPQTKALVVPTEAIQNGVALVVSNEETLEKRPVQTGFVSGDITVVTAGLAPGDTLVVTDPSIAIPGMAVKPVEDEARKAEIAAAALGDPAAATPGNGARKTGKVKP